MTTYATPEIVFAVIIGVIIGIILFGIMLYFFFNLLEKEREREEKIERYKRDGIIKDKELEADKQEFMEAHPEMIDI